MRAQHSPTTDAVLGARLKPVEAALGSPGAGDQSLVMMSTLVRALVFARSVESSELATRIMDVVRGSLKSRIADDKKAGQ